MNLLIVPYILFWTSVFIIFWAYFGYLITLKLISLVHTKTVHKDNNLPKVTLIITAHNEELRIQEKLDNALKLDYPRDRLEIIVVSDASTDNTEDIVRGYADHRVRLLIMPERNGKHYGQGKGIEAATSEIIVCSDATTFLDPQSVKNIVANFADPSIGCVSGQDRIATASGESQGEGVYIRYEMLLRELESKVGSLVGVSGSFFATRKSLCDQWISNLSSDFYLPSIAASRGLRSVSEPNAIGTYKVLHDPSREFTRKVRTVVHGLQVLFRFRFILNPFRYGGFSIQMISHKLCRWLVPFGMVLALPTNYFLIDYGPLYLFLFAGQLLFYAIIVASLLFESLQKVWFVKLMAFFAMVNYSILVAWYKFWTNQEYVVWDATKR